MLLDFVLTVAHIVVYLSILTFKYCSAMQIPKGIMPTPDMILPDPTSSSGRMNITDTQLSKIENLIKYSRLDWHVPSEGITWNPVQVENALMRLICFLNRPGNYPNPANCNQFIMCASPDQAFLGSCPYGGTYDPFADLCMYTVTNVPKCPNREVWDREDLPPTCENYGKRSYWSELTMSAHPEIRCVPDVIYCKNSKTIGLGKCPLGSRFSKGALACLPKRICLGVERDFNMPYPNEQQGHGWRSPDSPLPE